ncbi:hypothetical protein G4Y73_02900 [Wenzhouxiangella sp. XN201]|uniref:hypothetical protein n=1 Tax=Wenzhouxiangella sp. XN201 TaxID=2710755 RepID=UPI0013C6A7CC|nr:hypothetical protein [Wenzhouxiangella sp. XN201]NEZ03096.1 hypothetical protein [Wenzhouxiangella sp. XN201]
MPCLLLLVSGASIAQSACLPSSTTACLVQERFEVTVAFDTEAASFVPPAVGSVSGNAEVAFLTSDTVAFSFYDAEQMDVYVKVLAGCPVNDRFWVFAAGATDSQVTVSVTDTATGETIEYFSPAGQAFAPIADTDAFATCDQPLPAAQTKGPAERLRDDVRGTCGATFCLQDDRFALEVAFSASTGSSGQISNAASVDHSGLGWAFDSLNLDLLSTVIDGRADNTAFWFLTSQVGDLELEYTLTDTDTGRTNTYLDPLGPGLTLLDRGQPVDAEIRQTGTRGASGDAVSFELMLTNSAPAERTFSAAIPTPPGTSNPRFTCSAADGAVCPQASGSGAFQVDGPLAPGGRLSFIYSLDLAQQPTPDFRVEASVETAAHALSDARTLNRGVGITPAPSPVPLDARWALAILAMMVALLAARRLVGVRA